MGLKDRGYRVRRGAKRHKKMERHLGRELRRKGHGE